LLRERAKGCRRGKSLINPNVVAVTVGLTSDWATASVYLVEPTWFSNRKTLQAPQSPEAAEALHDHSKLGYGIRPLDTSKPASENKYPIAYEAFKKELRGLG
jgi:hypothetical protein